MTADKRQLWMWAVAAFNFAIGPLSTFVPIYILKLGGNAITVGLAFTLYNLVAIPASAFWGFLVDITGWRKPIVVISYGSASLILLGMYFAQGVYEVALLYAAIGLFAAAASTPLNLLVIETTEKHGWPSAFSLLNLLASAGVTVSLLFAATYSSAYSIRGMMLYLAAFGGISTLMSQILIEEPPVPLERRSLSLREEALNSRLLFSPLFFLRLPRIRGIFRSVSRRWRAGDPSLLVYVGIFLFYIASGLFNTMISPGLYRKGLSESLVFTVIMAGYVVQTLSYQYSGKYIERNGEVNVAVKALYLRAAGYVGIALSFLASSSALILGASMICYPMAAGLAFSMFYAAANVMVFKTLGANPGSHLGAYSSLVGLATLAGAFASGFTSYYVGYNFTYALAAAFLLASATILKKVKFRSSTRSACPKVALLR
ncbi:MAG: MFS transporter [TACK group archaeon]|nr:MFS transporter [TACK group archaeon]